MFILEVVSLKISVSTFESSPGCFLAVRLHSDFRLEICSWRFALILYLFEEFFSLYPQDRSLP